MNFKLRTAYILFLFLWFSCQNEAPPTSKITEDPIPTVKPVAIRKIEYPLDTTLTLQHLMGKFQPAKDTAFTKITKKYADREGMYLRKKTYYAFQKMHEAAQKDGIRLTIRSATRNFNRQKAIWEKKWSGSRKLEGNVNAATTFKKPVPRALKILEYSSMPSTSRHHWGTDIDLNNFNNTYFEKGKGLKEYEWLTANAKQYGFCQVYTTKDASRPDGYNEEKWHWSYLPIAQKLTELARREMKDKMIKGFKGSETATEIGVVEKYILGINQECNY